jgi:hypothetical protein
MKQFRKQLNARRRLANLKSRSRPVKEQLSLLKLHSIIVAGSRSEKIRTAINQSRSPSVSHQLTSGSISETESQVSSHSIADAIPVGRFESMYYIGDSTLTHDSRQPTTSEVSKVRKQTLWTMAAHPSREQLYRIIITVL